MASSPRFPGPVAVQRGVRTGCRRRYRGARGDGDARYCTKAIGPEAWRAPMRVLPHDRCGVRRTWNARGPSTHATVAVGTVAGAAKGRNAVLPGQSPRQGHHDVASGRDHTAEQRHPSREGGRKCDCKKQSSSAATGSMTTCVCVSVAMKDARKNGCPRVP